MARFTTLRDALRTQRMPDHRPLLTEDDVLRTIRNAPSMSAESTEPTTQPPTQAYRPSWLRRHAFGALGLAAASVVLLLVSLNLDDENPSKRQRIVLEQVNQEPPVSSNDVTASAESDGSMRKTDVASAAHMLRPDSIGGVPSLSAQQLNADKLGLTIQNSIIRYVEDGLQITIKTSGISARGTRSANAECTPRHITLYRKGKPFASWYDTAHAAINTLLPVRLQLHDEQNTMFPEAEVILWYVPTDAFLACLSSSVRTTIVQELANRNASRGYTEHATHSAIITSSTLFPNPVRADHTTLSITTVAPCVTSGRLVDLLGQLVRTLWMNNTHNVGTATIHLSQLSDLPNGMYLVVLQVDGSNEHIVQRLLIER